MTKPWYKDGLRFACTQCGQCCTGAPGYVWIDEKEILEMALFLKISVEEFTRTYTRQVNGRLSLKEFPKSYDCIFLRGKQCMLYGSRPRQCRTFPFWPENIESKKSWEETGKRCEGVNHEHAPVIPLSEINRQLKILDDE